MTRRAGVPRSATEMFSVRRIAMVIALTAAWCALWGGVSAANVMSGLIVASVASLTGSNAAGGIRVGPLLRLLWVVAVDLVVSTTVVVREVLTPTDHTDEAIIAVVIPSAARERHLLFLYIAITLTPGTAVVAGEDGSDSHDGGSTIYLHVLHDDRRNDVVEHVGLLTSLVTQAFPPPSARNVEEVSP